jgi:hypothetical protein
MKAKLIAYTEEAIVTVIHELAGLRKQHMQLPWQLLPVPWACQTAQVQQGRFL